MRTRRKRAGWKKWVALGMLLFLFGDMVPVAAYAQPLNVQLREPEQIPEDGDMTENGDTTEEPEMPEGELPELTEMESQDAADPSESVPQHVETTYYKDVNFSKVNMQGIYSGSELYFYIPEYWDTKYVYVELEYTVSQLIKEVYSALTFYVNNVPVESWKIQYKSGENQIAYVALPMSQIKEGYNSLTVSAYARLFDEEGCMDDYSSANWLAISDDSFVRCGYEVKDESYTIANYPYPFMSTMDESGSGLYLAVSDQAVDEEVAAAMYLMADLSTETEEENAIHFGRLSDMNAVNGEKSIIVSMYDNLPEEYKNNIPNVQGLQDYGLVYLTSDTKGRPTLLITSQNEKCLMEAVYMLMDSERVAQEKGDTAWVREGSSDVAKNALDQITQQEGLYTLKDMQGGGLKFVGPFHQEQVIYLPFTEDYFLSDAGKVTLKFRYSDNINFDRSMVTVYWGNIPVASKKLERNKTGGDELNFSMPDDVIGTTASSMRIAFDLEIPDMICTPRQEQMPWAYVAEESQFYLPASSDILLSFSRKPSPFQQDGRFSDLLLVLSDEPDSEELQMYAEVVGMLGEGVKPYGELHVQRFSEFSTKDADYNIIVAGTYSDSAVLRTLNEKLYFRYDVESGGFKSNDQLILSEQYAQDLAILQLLQSPYAANRGILAITGSNKQALNYVTEFVREKEKRYSLAGDCVLIDSNLKDKSYQFISSIENVQTPTVLGVLEQNKQSLLFTAIATLAMLMLLIAVAIILIRIKQYHRKQDEE